jgi:hypothetical protein
MPPFCLRARHHPERRGERCSRAPARRAALVIPGIASGGRGSIRPQSQRPHQSRYPGPQIRRGQPDPCARFISAPRRTRPRRRRGEGAKERRSEGAKEPLVRGRRFAAVDANAHLIPHRGVSPSCQKLPTVIKSLSACLRGHHCCLGWADLARVGYASITLPQWRSVDFLPLRWHAFLAMPKKVFGPPSSADAAAASGAG